MFRNYIELTKPKVTLLNLLVGITCFVLAAYPIVNWVNLWIFCLVGYLAAGGCGVFNSVYDRDIDRLMPRTAKRAIPAGNVKASRAVVLGFAMLTSSMTMSYIFFNTLTTVMVALGAIIYLFIYTIWLKRISSWNVVIGGFAGCFAALSGWAAAANTISLMPLMISALDFLWTPGHLWGLAIKKVKEYKAAGVPMLPVKMGITKASSVVFALNLLTVAFSLLFPLVHLAGYIFAVAAIAAGSVFLVQNRGLLVSPSETFGFKVFAASMPYLMCLMLSLIVDKLLIV